MKKFIAFLLIAFSALVSFAAINDEDDEKDNSRGVLTRTSKFDSVKVIEVVNIGEALVFQPSFVCRSMAIHIYDEEGNLRTAFKHLDLLGNNPTVEIRGLKGELNINVVTETGEEYEGTLYCP
ncbi:MAG: hypothetical protein K2G35_04460 [Duncaniella sp.]|nr:hypothetical protein [Duncaniella sp.]